MKRLGLAVSPSVLSSRIRQERVQFLFRGYCATLLSTGPFFAAYFPAYEVSRHWVKDKIENVREIQAERPGPEPIRNAFPPVSPHQFIVLGEWPLHLRQYQVQHEDRSQFTTQLFKEPLCDKGISFFIFSILNSIN